MGVCESLTGLAQIFFCLGFALFPLLFLGIDTGIQNWGPGVLAPLFVGSEKEPCTAFQVWALLQAGLGTVLAIAVIAVSFARKLERLNRRNDVSDRMDHTPIVHSILIKAHGKDACSFCCCECRDYDVVVRLNDHVMFHWDCLPDWVETSRLSLPDRGGDVEAGLPDPCPDIYAPSRLYPVEPQPKDVTEKSGK